MSIRINSLNKKKYLCKVGVVNTFNILIAGPAGTGVESVSHSLALHFTREGLFVHTHSEYENRIRGGNNYSQVRISDTELHSHDDSFDISIAMDENSITAHLKEIKEGGIIIYDGEKVNMEGVEIPKGIHMISVPVNKIATEIGLKLAANIVAVGALFALIGKKDDAFFSVIESQFSKKGEEIIQINKKALEKGYEYVHENFQERVLCNLEGDKKKRSLLFGNEAIALGCIKAGMKFLAAYPMTPGSTIMTVLAKEARNYNVVVSHVEDEIAAVNMAIGAGAAGIRAATSTSGGGFSLMAEAVSFSGMTESPVVIFNAQRPGPSTGLPTRTAQADLRMAMHCGQGDFPRLVIAVGDQEECIRLTVDAFNFAEKFQIPVIVLTEKYIADSYKSIEMDVCDDLVVERGEMVDSSKCEVLSAECEGDSNSRHSGRSEESQKNLKERSSGKLRMTDQVSPDGRFPRYADTPNGVSPRPIFGTKGGEHIVNSYEHDAYGMGVEEVEDVKIMIDKRWKKMKALEEALPDPKLYPAKCLGDSSKCEGASPPLFKEGLGEISTVQDSNSDIVLFLFGGTKGPALEAQKLLSDKEIFVDIIQMQFIHPFKSDVVKEMLSPYKKIICIEGNQSGQLEGVLMENTGIKVDHSIRSFYGRAFTAKKIVEKIVNFEL